MYPPLLIKMILIDKVTTLRFQCSIVFFCCFVVLVYVVVALKDSYSRHLFSGFEPQKVTYLQNRTIESESRKNHGQCVSEGADGAHRT